MTSEYIEINSTYRNRNLWPKPGQFEIPISQTGIKNNKLDAIDPVSLAEPLVYWSPNAFIITGSIGIPGTLIDSLAPPSVIGSATTSPNIYIIYFNSPPQTLENYYTGAVLFIANVNNQRSRITYYKYLGQIGGQFRALVYLEEPLVDVASGETFTITDPSDDSIPAYPLFFVPNGKTQQNSYSNYYLYNESDNTYELITFYDSTIRIISTQPWIDYSINLTTSNFCIRKDVPIFPSKGETNVTIDPMLSSSTQIYVPYVSTLNTTTDYYKNLFLRGKPDRLIGPNGYYYAAYSESRQIISSYYDITGPYIIFIVNTPYTLNLNSPAYTYNIEILPFSYDNVTPFTYSGTLIQQQSCYEFELINLILPNITLSSGNGSKIAFYPFVYVELSNVSATGSHLTNIIQSNNPNATRMIFRVPIYDVQDAATTPFVRLVESNMIQTIKFKPNDNLLFSVRLSNGDVYNTIIPETFSPSVPNQDIQISAIFRYKRI
jgi:hypothetical protein